MRNTSYEVRKTDEEAKREKEKAPTNAEEAWKRGYGSGFDLTWLYLAMVRAAGFEAYGIMAADRENYFFDPALMQSRRLDENFVLIKLNGKEYLLRSRISLYTFWLAALAGIGHPGIET